MIKRLFSIRKLSVYDKINQDLAGRFGRGNVEFRKSETASHKLWFNSNHPQPETIEAAKAIVARYIRVQWFDDQMEVTEE